MGIVRHFSLFSLVLFLFLCLYDVTWMKASDYGILPRNIEMQYQLVKLLYFGIPVLLSGIASGFFFQKVRTPSGQNYILLIGLAAICLLYPIVASIALRLLGCFVFYTYFEACI
jgi:hypothetical protein